MPSHHPRHPTGWRLFSRALIVVVACLAACPVPASAQNAPAPAASSAAAPSADELGRLLDTLQDDKKRADFVAELRALVAAQHEGDAAAAPTPATLLGALSARLEAISGEIVAAAQVAVDLPRLFAWLRQQVSDADARAFWFEIGLKLAAILLAAIAAEWGLRLALRRPRRRLAAAVLNHPLLRLASAAARSVLDALPLLGFAAAAYAVLPFTHPRFATIEVATTLVGAYVTCRVVVAVARIVLVPRVAKPVIPLEPEARSYLYVWCKRFAVVAVYGYALTDATWWLGVPGGIYALLLKAVALVLATLATIFVLQNRAVVAAWLHGAEGRSDSGWRLARARFAEIWHILAILYVVGIFLVYALRVEGGFAFVLRATVLSVVVIAASRFAVNLIGRASRRGFAVSADLRARFPTLEARANRYIPILTVTAGGIVYAFAVLAVLQAWNVPSFAWFGTDAARRATSGLVTVAIVLVAALVLWEVFSSAIERYLRATDGAAHIRRSARARTLLPLFRTSMFVVLVVIVSFIVLSQLGVNIAPLLAGAGVVGIAVGFGSQALVKDVITGLFILIEDSLAIGDVVDIGKGHAGVVEALSVRTIRLRDNAGTLHTVPFSEVTSINNLTRDYAYVVANVAVSYREDLDRVEKVLRDIGAGLRNDPEYRSFILEPLEFVGIDKMSELGIVIQVRIKTLPMRQWTVGRAFYRRAKESFDRAGIEVPYALKPGYLAEIEARQPQATAAQARSA